MKYNIKLYMIHFNTIITGFYFIKNLWNMIELACIKEKMYSIGLYLTFYI